MPSQTVADARAAFVLALACAATALAIWLVPASVHVVGWDGDQVSMVSLLPPASRLGLILGVTVTIALVLGVVARRRQRLLQLARIVAPLTLLFFLGVCRFSPRSRSTFPCSWCWTGRCDG